MGESKVSVSFHGVRGSTACHDHQTHRYGGNTSCVSLQAKNQNPIIFDLGTGLRYMGGQNIEAEAKPFVGACLLTHLHWDHVQGLPFFKSLLCEETVLDIYAPKQEDGRNLRELFLKKIGPPIFPISLDEFHAQINFHEIGDDDFMIGSTKITSRFVPHVGPTLGFRVTSENIAVTYLPDHQQPVGNFSITGAARQLCQGTDLLIHDSQYTPAEFETKSDWGHSTLEYAMWVAETTSAKKLALFHHDPSRTDDALDVIAQRLAVAAKNRGLEVFAAADGLTVEVCGVV
ncbi:MAG: MBL fold metallo-hydrolase [Actinomycetota bacterium]